MKYIILVLSLLALIANCQDDVVQISTGYLRGNVYPTHREFLGIPFGEPPIGEKRWTSPVAIETLGNDVYDSTYQRAGCSQQCILPAGVCPTNTSEDCLYLNVYTPAVQPDQTGPLPVMFFIPGGRFEMGAANTVIYNSTVVVNTTSVIMVTINYRLGALGFLVTDTFVGNYGFEDQLLALQWVQDNIKGFGGDPTQVTLYGESAGGSSAALHLTSPASAGLFSKLMIESNPWSLPTKSSKELQDLAKKFAGDLGCDVSDNNCLLSASVDDILQAQNKSDNTFTPFAPLLTFLPWTPVVDGKLITDQPIKLIQEGNYNKVPVLLGTVHDEALLFIASVSTDISKIEFIGGIMDIFGIGNEFRINSLYGPLQNQSSNNYMDLMGRIGTDYVFVCPTRNVAVNMAKYNPVYLYQFQHVTSFNVYGNTYPMCADVVCHGLELPYIFDTASLEDYTFTPEEQALSFQMINYWTNFAKNADPSIGNPVDVQWPRYNSTDYMMTFQTPSFIQTGYLAEYCDFWDNLNYQYNFGY
ncbi:putative cholinesterase [Tieghemostelium lacteum]|uniref:Carboxylic ester hydrolase n=1 Tax=Tieghemostelium lacteum TaxID=361077 RepID=A0A151Z9C9_TIELA|nr:putative cholinesterase [Tieghemostelium lacteum]|eukprot:KYQ90474.1 putative cholinesterase [Tieghemostelium lacteum]